MKNLINALKLRDEAKRKLEEEKIKYKLHKENQTNPTNNPDKNIQTEPTIKISKNIQTEPTINPNKNIQTEPIKSNINSTNNSPKNIKQNVIKKTYDNLINYFKPKEIDEIDEIEKLKNDQLIKIQAETNVLDENLKNYENSLIKEEKKRLKEN